MYASPRSEIRIQLLAALGCGALLLGCGSSARSGAKQPDAAAPQGTGGGIGWDGGRSDVGLGTGGASGAMPDASLGTGGVVDASTATGGGAGRTTLGTGGIPGRGGTSGAEDGGNGSGGSDGRVLTCEEIPGPCTSTSTASFVNPPAVSSTEYFYDARGLVIRTIYTSSDQTQTTYLYTYDEAGRMLEEKNDKCEGSRYGCVWYSYAYDDQGRMLAENNMSNSASVVPGCTQYTYDADGLRSKEVFFPGCGTAADGEVTYAYDSARRLSAIHSSKVEYLGSSSNIAFAYDNAGQVIRETYADDAGAVKATVAYTRNAAGQVVSQATRYADGSGQEQVFTYNAQGKELTRKTVALAGTTPGKESNCFTFTYDACGTNQTSYQLSPGCDGSVSSQATYSYACFGGP